MLPALLETMRPKQWPKNGFLFAALIFDGQLTHPPAFLHTIPLRQGWQISASPTFSYDRNAPPGEAWSFPVGGGVAKTSILGRTPWKFAAQYWYYVASPNTFGTRNQLRISVSPVNPLPW